MSDQSEAGVYRCTCGATFDSAEVREIHEYNGHTVAINDLEDA